MNCCCLDVYAIFDSIRFLSHFVEPSTPCTEGSSSGALSVHVSCLAQQPKGFIPLLCRVATHWPHMHAFTSSLPQVRAKLAMLNKQWPVAETLLLSQGKLDDCIAMYQDIHKWVTQLEIGFTVRCEPRSETKLTVCCDYQSHTQLNVNCTILSLRPNSHSALYDPQVGRCHPRGHHQQAPRGGGAQEQALQVSASILIECFGRLREAGSVWTASGPADLQDYSSSLFHHALDCKAGLILVAYQQWGSA